METVADAFTRDAGLQGLFQATVFGSDICEGGQIAAVIIRVVKVSFLISMNSVE
jgi:hypothetical protein